MIIELQFGVNKVKYLLHDKFPKYTKNDTWLSYIGGCSFYYDCGDADNKEIVQFMKDVIDPIVSKNGIFPNGSVHEWKIVRMLKNKLWELKAAKPSKAASEKTKSPTQIMADNGFGVRFAPSDSKETVAASESKETLSKQDERNLIELIELWLDSGMCDAWAEARMKDYYEDSVNFIVHDWQWEEFINENLLMRID